MPVVGMTPVTAITLMNACMQIHDVMPPASRAPNRSGARSEARTPRHARNRNAAEHRDSSDQPELLADDGEDEVRVRLGQPLVLLHRVAEADAEDPARAERVERLAVLESGAERVRARVEEVRRGGPRGTRRARRAPTPLAPKPTTIRTRWRFARPGEREQDERRRRDDDRAAEVALGEHEREQDAPSTMR